MTKKNVLTYLLSAGILLVFGVIFFSTKHMSYPTVLTSEMSLYYLEYLTQTGAVNAVSAILLDFRAYDTLGEILVLFATISGVMLIARRAP
jgi:multisubunit Na+/H+ antiporter MnhB subunit